MGEQGQRRIDRTTIGPTAVGGSAPRTRGVGGTVLGLTILFCVAGTPRPAATQELPDQVTPRMVETGRTIFARDGFCYTCHGQDGRGVPNLGSDLTDGQWDYADGSYGSLVERIRKGVPANVSNAGVPMPPAGGGKLNDEQVRAVAAYVWTLSGGGG